MIEQDYYSYALDKNSQLIRIYDAIKGSEYYCPNCGEVMIPRQGEIRKWHFAHKANLENCSYESYLHKLAKRLICDCFNESPSFNIRYRAKGTCSEQKCSLDKKKFCSWNIDREIDLKQYYDQCKEEVKVDKFKADLCISHSSKIKLKPVFIEIWVTHKSSEEKLNSKYHIIEIHITSEDDIQQIVHSHLIKESDEYIDYWGKIRKIQFHNFKSEYKETPSEEHQLPKYLFWMDSQNHFHFDKCLCLSPGCVGLKEAIYSFESQSVINLDFALAKLVDSGFRIRHCKICTWQYGADCILRKLGSEADSLMEHIAYICRFFEQQDHVHINRFANGV